MRLYFNFITKKNKNLNDLRDEAIIGLPNDPSNLTRCLLVLESANLIKLGNSKTRNLTVKNIIENKKHLKFRLEDASELFSLLDEVDATFINGNFADKASLAINKDAIFVEKSSSPYANIIAVRPEDLTNPNHKKWSYYSSIF